MISKVKSKLIYLAFFLLTMLFGCDDKKPFKQCEIDHEIIKPSKKRDIVIDVKGLQYKHEQSHSAYYNDTNWYIGLDLVRNSLDFFDITNEKFEKSIIFKNDGSEGSINVSEFYFHNKDSIILFSEQGKIQVRNIKDSLINEISLKTEKLMGWSQAELTAGLGDSEAKIFFDPFKKDLYISNIPPVYYDSDNYYSVPTIVSFNLKEEDFVDFGTLVPEDINNYEVTPTTRNDWLNIVNSFEDGDILVSYFDSQFYSKGKLGNHDSLNLLCRRSHFYNQEIPSIDMNDFNKEREYVFKKGIYAKSFFHSKYNRYVNSVRHNQDYINAEGKVNNPYHADFSILVLDNNFNALKEFKIPSGKYNFNKVYPHSEGVLIMKENPNDENNEEDLLEFSVFAID
ncbi:DUF4221 family protein [Marivirga sp.]|uniref:DUF4221 family protein n=1 Tax=Marivirga sp. TaxID=2018662 RepID=UPI002D807599|nr:DUF4221 family protein [Marivirga sp.]HET8860246.1 DUF4221 family protein [Marivirga sp.]